MIEEIIIKNIVTAIHILYRQQIKKNLVQVQKTKKEFKGDLTLVVFPLLRFSKKSPEQTAEEIGDYLQSNLIEIDNFNVIKGFLNLNISENYWLDFFNNNCKNIKYGFLETTETHPVVVEFSSPNTNKPLHLGHIRNNLIGNSVAEILKASGKKVVKVNLVNDRGIHISKSMLAWEKWGTGDTPESSGKKGDKLVGDYYVKFEQENQKEISRLMNEGYSEEEAAKKSPLIIEAQDLLKKWEARQDDVRNLWQLMNNWVYEGFDKTYKRLGIDFDKIYYESKTYLLGKALVEQGLQKGILFRKDDGSVWADLIREGLDKKLLIRSDGTSVYMTQDIGTAKLRYDEYHPEKLIYVVGNEQNYHFTVLKIILKKLGNNWADNIIHLSYGMVELPHGKMKSREGTIVDADELMVEMFDTAKKTTEDLGKIEGFTTEEANKLFETIGIGALKYFILKVDPKKNMLFDPVESIDFAGKTGPFIQYTYARIQSLLRKAENSNYKSFHTGQIRNVKILQKEKDILKLLYDFPGIIKQAADNLSPALIANYIYELVKEYNQFYQEIPILKEENKDIIIFRLALSEFTGRVIKTSMELLGIDVPDRM